MENKFKQSVADVMKVIFAIPTHSVDYMKEELQVIYLNKYYTDNNKDSFINPDLTTDTSKITDTIIKEMVDKFLSVSKFNFDTNEYATILKNFDTFDLSKVNMTEYDIMQVIGMALNDEINKKMTMVMNAVKGLRQDLYQNGYATGVNAYKETIRMLFLRMIEDKKLKNGDLDLRFYLFTMRTFKDNYSIWVRSNPTDNSETDFLNSNFRQEVLNLGGDEEEEYSIYSKLFRDDEKIISNRQMIYNFITKLEGVNIVDLMDYGKDVLGVVYESYIGDVQNSGAGQIFTPTDVVDFMTEVAELTKDDVCLDFCSGSGRFMTSAMRRMIADARETIKDHKELEEKIDHIKHQQVYGADLDSNPTLNTKRNMALAGDGSSHIANMNSLFIEHEEDEHGNVKATFINGKGVNKDELVGIDGERFSIDNCTCILTNPPFGDLTLNDDYNEAWIDEFRNTFKDACKSELKRWKPQFTALLETLKNGADKDAVIEQLDDLLDITPIKRDAKVEKSFESLKEAIMTDDEKKITKHFDDIFKNGVRTVSTIWKTNKKGEKTLTGTTNYKGCLLFLYKAYQILKVGGKVLIVVDDGVLNTDNYAFARDFIRNKFYIKAVFSLSDKAFYAHSDKMIKTSILYLEKKKEIIDADGDIYTEKQVDPVFYAHVQKTGQNSKRGKYESHFDQITQGYFDFIKAVEDNKAANNGSFNKKTFRFDEMTIQSQTFDEEGEDNEVNVDEE